MAVSWSQLVRRHKKRHHARAAITSGAWKRLHPGAYVEAGESLDWQTRAAAALKWLPLGILSHHSAARLHGLEFLNEVVEVSVPKKAGARSTSDITIFRSEVPWEDRTMLKGLRCTTLPRTLLDLAPHVPFIDLAIAVEDAWREKDEALAAFERILASKLCRGRAGASTLRAIVEDCRQRGKPLRSALEVRMWWLLKISGLPLPIPGYRVADEFGGMEIDFAWPALKIALETDGKKFHPRERFDYDATRQSRLVALGWRVPRFTYAAIVFRPDQVVNLVSAAIDPPPMDPCEVPAWPSGDSMDDVGDPFVIPPCDGLFDAVLHDGAVAGAQ